MRSGGSCRESLFLCLAASSVKACTSKRAASHVGGLPCDSKLWAVSPGRLRAAGRIDLESMFGRHCAVSRMLSADRIWLLWRLTQLVGLFVLVNGTCVPLAPVIPDELRPMISLHWKIIVRFGRDNITALNFIYNVNPAIPSAHNAAQLDVVTRVVSLTCDLAQHMHAPLWGTWEILGAPVA